MLLFAYAALMTHFIFGRAFRDSLLGSELAIQSLPSLTMWSTLVSIILSLTVSNLFRSRPRKRIACAGFALNLIIELLFASASPRFARGWTQGYPKRLGQVFQTRYFAATGRAGPALAPGSKFAGSATSAGHRIAEGIVTLRKPVTDMSLLKQKPVVNLLHTPRLAADKQDQPAIHELVENVPHDVKIEQAWMGEGFLTLPICKGEELSDLAPLRTGKGVRASLAYVVDDLKTLKDLRR